ncbi:MAG TPA: cytochrome c biogenesis protein CcdA [Candidatus Dormibacteraeota bacterium]|nr:cytochrome c biogenesis protein CcdA [Candidatus Dormibacteraeota bacterium]
MTLDNVTVPLAFAAGAVSFLSPCVVPLVPVYVAYLARSPADSTVHGPSRVAGTSNAVAFVAGVSLVFLVLFYALRALLQPFRFVILPIAGVLVVVFALHLAGLIRIPGLDREFRLVRSAPRTTGPLGGFLLGVAFAAGWTPCIGPVLGAVLTSSATAGTTALGLLVVLAYCAGLGLPFLALGIGVGRASATVRQANRWRKPIDLASAGVLGAMGVLLLTNNLTVITELASRVLPNVDPFGL